MLGKMGIEAVAPTFLSVFLLQGKKLAVALLEEPGRAEFCKEVVLW